MFRGTLRRPRLARHAAVRRHLVSQEAPAEGLEIVVIVHDTTSDGLVRLGPREWTILRAADGTRDLEGVCRAAGLGGTRTSVDAVSAFLTELASVGLVVDGSESDDDGGGPGVEASKDHALDPAARTIAARPVLALPSFRLSCDGGGSCCRLYASVIFSGEEEARARAHCPGVLEGGRDREAAFTPESGPTFRGAHAAALIDGACAYLNAHGRCAIHAAAGPGAKPRGCELFPALFVDDGDQIVVSPALECACVFASAGGVDGEPLVSPEIADGSALDPRAFVQTVPDELAVGEDGRHVSRRQAIEWAQSAREALRARPRLETLWEIAAALGHGAPEPSPRASNLPPADLSRYLTSLRARLSRRASDDDTWRAPRDLARRSTRWMLDAALELESPATLAAALHPDLDAAERFYLDVALFGHHLLVDGSRLDRAIIDRVVRLVLARAMAATPPDARSEHDPALRYPLALVEAMMRGHGLRVYRAELP